MPGAEKRWGNAKSSKKGWKTWNSGHGYRTGFLAPLCGDTEPSLRTNGVERGFSVNKEVETWSIKEQTVVAQRLVGAKLELMGVLKSHIST